MEKKKCPNCGSLNVIDIIYGLPTEEAFLLSEEGYIKLGGCVINFPHSKYFCKNCEFEW